MVRLPFSNLKKPITVELDVPKMTFLTISARAISFFAFSGVIVGSTSLLPADG
jgi:hypothetical protein